MRELLSPKVLQAERVSERLWRDRLIRRRMGERVETG